MGAKKAKIMLLVFGFILILFGLVLFCFYDQIIFYTFEKELPLKPGSESFRKWRVTPVPLTMNIYFWNWTNPHQVGEDGYKPHFTEMGPYSFREVHEKVNITWNKNGTITFKTIKRWYFNEEGTNGSIDDNVTSVNAVAASVAYLTRSWNRFFLYPVSATLVTSGQQLTWTKTVRELMFDGFDNSLQSLGRYMPGFPDHDKFGWFYKRNGTVSSDIYTIATGTNGLQEMGKLELWNYKNKTNYYPECPEVDGFNGEFWPPKRSKNDTLDMFTTDMCRKVVYYYQEESSHKGLKTLVFAGTKDSVDNGTIITENKCYCDTDGCPPSGVFDVSKCQYGAPIFISYPHFYNADPYYINSIEGMNPSQDKHRFYIELEPRTGVQVEVAARMQINVYLKKNSALSIYRNVKDVFIPVFWLENRVSLSDEYTVGIKIMLTMVEMGPFIYYGMCLVGCLLLLMGIILFHGFTAFLSDEKRNINTQGSEKGVVRITEDIQLEDRKIKRKTKPAWFVVRGNRERLERDRDNSRRPTPKRYPEEENERSEFPGKAEAKNRREMDRREEERTQRKNERVLEEAKRRREEEEKNKKKKRLKIAWS